MAKAKTQFVCTSCGGTAAKLMGRCPHCGEWNTMQEEVIDNGKSPEGKNRYQGFATRTAKVQDLDSVNASDYIRKSTNIPEFDRVLGGGLVDGVSFFQVEIQVLVSQLFCFKPLLHLP